MATLRNPISHHGVSLLEKLDLIILLLILGINYRAACTGYVSAINSMLNISSTS
jgi:hypothetical protein